MRTGGQRLETQPPSGLEGTGPQVKAGRGKGGVVQGMAEEVWNLQGGTHRGQ